MYEVSALPPVFDGATHESCTPFPLAVAALRLVGAPGRPAETTLTDALPWIPPMEAITEPLPALVPAVNIVEAELVEGETIPSEVGLTDHAAIEAATGFPYASAPPAVKACVPPVATVAELGETTMLASAPAFTASACVPLVEPLELAVRVGVPALVSS